MRYKGLKRSRKAKENQENLRSQGTLVRPSMFLSRHLDCIVTISMLGNTLFGIAVYFTTLAKHKDANSNIGAGNIRKETFGADSFGD